MAYSPAFQFYYKDFRQDPNTIRMTTLEIGAYWLLIVECWDRENRLPKDLESLADIARMPVEDFSAIWKRALERCFREKKTFYFHKRVGEEILKQKGWKKEKSEAGKIGAAKRWKNKQLQNGSAIAVPSSAMADDSSSSSSSSSSSLKTQAVAASAKSENQNLDPNRAIQIVRIVTGITAAMKVKQLPNKPGWMKSAEWAISNGFGADLFLECYALLSQQKWRNGAIKPSTVIENLPFLDRLRDDLAKQNGSLATDGNINGSKYGITGSPPRTCEICEKFDGLVPVRLPDGSRANKKCPHDPKQFEGLIILDR